MLECRFNQVLDLCRIGNISLHKTHLAPAIRFLRSPGETAHARRLFMATLLFLPAYLGTLVVDRFFL